MSTARIANALEVEYYLDRMTEHDLLEVVEIEEMCGLSIWGWDGYRTELDRAESVMLVARLPRADRAFGRLLFGFVAARVNADELHINNIGVRHEARRRGVGTALLREALEMGALYGARRALLEVRASNGTAQALYMRHGFRVAGRRRSYYKNPTEDAQVMVSDLRA